jgi:hypothetical protein
MPISSCSARRGSTASSVHEPFTRVLSVMRTQNPQKQIV